MSPEQFAEFLGVSGMTLRRWRGKSPKDDIPSLYEKAVASAACQLISEGKIVPSSKAARAVLAESDSASFRMTLKHLGLSPEILKGGPVTSNRLVECLSYIGAQEGHKTEVDRNKKRILSFKKMGEEWKSRLSSLMTVLRSPELTTLDKLVAYGALFYLLSPIDLIPDYIPVFGYMDDFLILGLAAAYYAKRYPHLFGKKALGR